MPSITTENYLKTIYQLQEKSPEDGLVKFGDIAKELQLTRGTITTMMKSLAERGLVEYYLRNGVQLTEEGRKQATNVVRRHRLIELFLVDVLHMDWAMVHEDAEALEHAISPRVLDRINAMMGHPEKDPHGDPIPGNNSSSQNPSRLTLLQAEGKKSYEVSRIDNQDPVILDRVATLGLKPGSRFQPNQQTKSTESVSVVVNSKTITVPHDLAECIRVKTVS